MANGPWDQFQGQEQGPWTAYAEAQTAPIDEKPGFLTQAGAAVEALGRGLVGMAGTVATAPGAAIGATMAGGSLPEIGEAAAGAAGQAMEALPRVFGEETKGWEEFIGKWLMEKPMEWVGEAAVQSGKSPFKAGPGGLPFYLAGKAAEMTGMDPDAFLRTAGERGTEALLYALGASFLKGGKAPPRGAKAAEVKPSVAELEALRTQAEVSDNAKLQQFRDQATQKEAFPETMRPVEQVLTPEEIARRQEVYDVEQAGIREQVTGQGELFKEPVEPRPSPVMETRPPMEEILTPETSAQQLRVLQEAAKRPETRTMAVDEISRTLDVPREWVEQTIAKTEIVPAGKPIIRPKHRGAVGDLTRKIEKLPEEKKFEAPAFRVKTTGEIVTLPGARVHLQVLPRIKERGLDFRNVEDGFVDRGGKWVSRNEAKQRWGSSISEDLQAITRGEPNLPGMFPGQRGGAGIPPDLATRIRQRLGVEPREPAPTLSEFDRWKANLPDEYKPEAKRLFDQFKKNEETRIAEEVKASPASDSRNVGKLEGLGHWTPNLKTYEQVKSAFMETKDTSRKGRFFGAGASMVATIKGHPALKWGADWIKSAKDNAEALTFQLLSDSKKGWLPEFATLPKSEKLMLFNAIIDNNGIRWLSPEEMVKQGFSNKQISVYESYRETVGKVRNYVNAVRALKNLDPIKDVPGYFPARWHGRYYIEIRTKDGRLLAVETSNKQLHLEALRKRFSRDYDVSKINSREAQRISPKDDFKYRPLFDQIAETLGKDSFERTALEELIGQFYESQGWRRANFPKHFEPKTGVGGYRGAQAGLELTDRMYDGLESLQAYVRDAHEWGESQQAHKQVGDFLADANASHLENVKSYLEEYWNHSYGNETLFAQAIRDTLRGLERSLETYPIVGGREIAGGIRALRRAAIVTMLGFYRPSFLLTQIVQVPQMMLPALAEVRVRAPDRNYTHSQTGATVIGLADTFKIMFDKKLDPFAQKAYDYATENGIVHPKFLNDIRDVTELQPWKNKLKWITGEHAINKIEQSSRTAAYMQTVRALEGSLDGKVLFETARQIVDQAMTNYRPHERAMAFTKLGELGKLIDPLTTFKVNYINQLVKYTKLAIEDPTHAAHWKPLALALYTNFMIAGVMGTIALKELDFIIDTMKRFGWIDSNRDNATSFLLKQSSNIQGKGRDFLRYGALSTITGANLSPHFAMSQVIPHSWRELLPVPGKLTATGLEAARALGPGSTSIDLQELSKELPGGIPQALAEFSRTSPSGILQEPSRNLEGSIRRRTDIPDPYRMAGTRAIPESEEMTALRGSQSKAQIQSQVRGSALDQAKELYLTGKSIDQPLASYIQAGGDPQMFVREMISAFEKSQTTTVEREAMRLKTIQQLRKWIDMNEYGPWKAYGG